MNHRVFLSSTFTDLAEYRRTVQGAIRQLGTVDVSMEHFGARDERPADECVRLVRQESDLFVGIYAYKYGYVPDGADVSISEWNIRQPQKPRYHGSSISWTTVNHGYQHTSMAVQAGNACSCSRPRS